MRPLSATVCRAARFGLCLTLALPLTALSNRFSIQIGGSQFGGAGVAFARGAPDGFADLAEKLLPAVVNVSSTQSVQTAKGGPPSGPDVPIFPPGSPFEQFFKDFLNHGHPGQNGDTPRPERRAQSLGSGFIIDASGLVVTNNHVIEVPMRFR
jgi:serine protease Do